MFYQNAEILIDYIRKLIKIQTLLNTVENTSSIRKKKSILNSFKEDEDLRKVIKYTYDSNLNYGDDVEKNILNLEESDTLDDIYSIWFMLDRLSASNGHSKICQEFRDYMLFFPDINDLVTRILKKDLKLGLSTVSIYNIFKNFKLSDKDFNNNKVIQLFGN